MSAQDITIRHLAASDADLADIAAQLNAADSEVAENFTAASLRRFLSDPSRFYLIATLDGQLAYATHGYVYPHPAGPVYVYVDEVDTVAAYRRRGVAKAMMAECLAIGRAVGADEVWLGADDGNDPARLLYEGLEPSTIEPGRIYTWKV